MWSGFICFKTVYEHLHDGSGSTKGEDIFEEFSDCEFLKSDYDQWIQKSRVRPTERVKKKIPTLIRKHKAYSALNQSLNTCQNLASYGRLILQVRGHFLGLEIPT